MSLVTQANSLPVSVIIPCFRCTRTIRRAMDSVLQQTRQPAEIILIDDASGDNTLSVLQSLEQQYMGWVKVVALKNNVGAASARNAGWAVATQPYLAFLDADDAWHPQKIEIQYAYMQQHPDVVLCGHNRRILTQENELPHWEIPAQTDTRKIRKWHLLLSNQFVTPSVMLRREIEDRFIEHQRHMEDHMLWLAIVCSGGIVTKLSPELAAIYKRPFGEAGLSSQIWLMGKSDLSNYRRLHQRGYINLTLGLLLGAYSLLKFIRRLVIYWGYIRWKK